MALSIDTGSANETMKRLLWAKLQQMFEEQGHKRSLGYLKEQEGAWRRHGEASHKEALGYLGQQDKDIRERGERAHGQEMEKLYEKYLQDLSRDDEFKRRSAIAFRSGDPAKIKAMDDAAVRLSGIMRKGIMEGTIDEAELSSVAPFLGQGVIDVAKDLGVNVRASEQRGIERETLGVRRAELGERKAERGEKYTPEQDKWMKVTDEAIDKIWGAGVKAIKSDWPGLFAGTGLFRNPYSDVNQGKLIEEASKIRTALIERKPITDWQKRFLETILNVAAAEGPLDTSEPGKDTVVDSRTGKWTKATPEAPPPQGIYDPNVGMREGEFETLFRQTYDQMNRETRDQEYQQVIEIIMQESGLSRPDAEAQAKKYIVRKYGNM